MAKCTTIGYGFLPFSFSSLGELEANAVTLLKRIHKFFMAQDIRVRAAVHIFNRISFAIAKGVGAQIANIYVMHVTQMAESTFFLSTRQMALWKSQMEDHTSDWLRVVPISGLGQTMNYRTYRSGKEVDIGLGGGRDKPLRRADMLLYSWDKGLDVCVDLIGSSPLTQTGMIDFVLGRAVMVIEVAQRKRVKYAG
ncbi:hypothetical protein Tco_0958422 [Tanacetum coccineum]